MTTLREIPAELLQRSALVYVRQSTEAQVRGNLESQRQQYGLAELAHSYGFRDVRIIDDDLGVSAGGTMDRPGFRDLVAQICQGSVGAVFCIEASRLARNGRDWHQLIELCGFMGARVIDDGRVYDPANPDDRLVLGLKGTMCEFELTVLRRRMRGAAIAKARRGELRTLVPLGYVWSQDAGPCIDPDRRIQEAIRSVFRLFDQLGSARQVVLCLQRDKISFPRSSDGRTLKNITWSPAVYGSVIGVLRNPFYAGAYVYGRRHAEKGIVDGHIRRKQVRVRPIPQWDILIRNHHEGYISWEQFEQNQQRLARNAYGKAAGPAKSGRGGGALLSSVLRCRRCARMLMVQYRTDGTHRYLCRAGSMTYGAQGCVSFAGRTADQAVAAEIVVAVQPLAVEAALMAERAIVAQHDQRRRALELECEQAAYEVKLAARRYEAVDPDNRLVAAELEARWNTALARLRECETRMTACQQDPAPVLPDRDDLLALATDLKVVWNTPTTDMRTKQRLVRSLIEEIVVDVDQAASEIILVIHWRGGQHSELRVHRARPGGGKRKRASDEADKLVREMAGKWSDAVIAATLNRLGIKTALNETWNRQRVHNHRHNRGIADQPGDSGCLTMAEAASQLGITCHDVRALINTGTLPAKQVSPDAPWHIEAKNLELPAVRQALKDNRRPRGRPRRYSRDDCTLVIPGTCKDGA